jgi:iron-sulfur cluster assembly 2
VCRVVEHGGAQVVVDDVSFGLIRGATVDFVEELIRAGFEVTKNPNAQMGCGCGTSFALKE